MHFLKTKEKKVERLEFSIQFLQDVVNTDQMQRSNVLGKKCYLTSHAHTQQQASTQAIQDYSCDVSNVAVVSSTCFFWFLPALPIPSLLSSLLSQKKKK